MKKSKLFLSLLLGACVSVSAFAQEFSNEQLARNVAENILRQPLNSYVDKDGNVYKTTKDIPKGVDVSYSSPLMAWHYANGVLDMAMINLGKYLGEQKYIDYAKNHVYYGFDNAPFFQKTFRGDRRHYQWPFGEQWTFRELDDCGAMGAAVVDVYGLTTDKKYKKLCEQYIANASNHVYSGQVRLDDGTLVRTFPHDKTVWADDMYMSVSLLSKMYALTKDVKWIDMAAKQVVQIGDYLWDPAKGLHYHCYYTDMQRHGVAYWGRANGWIAYSTCMLLDVMPKDHPMRAELIGRLERQIVGYSRYQDGDGMWHQLIDKNDSYQESSVSTLFVYAVAKGINNGWINPAYKSIATRGWNGLKKSQITPEGRFTNVCVGTGIQEDNVFYYTRPVGDNEKHGLGLVIDTVIEMMKLDKATATK